MRDITIYGTNIRQDSEGRFSLNDLHRASGGASRHAPAQWLRLQQAQDLIAELKTMGISTVSRTVGRNGGTYVPRELVFAYAMWVRPKFHIEVIRAYDRLVSPLPANTAPSLLDAHPKTKAHLGAVFRALASVPGMTIERRDQVLASALDDMARRLALDILMLR